MDCVILKREADTGRLASFSLTPLVKAVKVGEVMYYIAKVTQEGKYYLAEFPDAPGCQTLMATVDRSI